MNDPRYVHRPLSTERKAALSRAQRRRLGVPADHRLIYGVHVPEDYAPVIRECAETIARKKNYAAAQRFVQRAQENNWRVRRDVWTDRDIKELGERWRAGETGLQIGKALGRSRSAILGKIGRMGLRRPPAGHSEVPVTMIHPMITEALGLTAPDERNPEFRTAMILVAPMFVAWVPDEMARWTGYSRKECAEVAYKMTINGIWKAGKPDLDRYMQGDDKPGLQMGDMCLVLDTLLCLGKIRCEHGGERWLMA